MVLCGSYMFEFSVSKDMKKKTNNDERRILAYLIVLCLTLIVKELKCIFWTLNEYTVKFQSAKSRCTQI